jgi:hypothetical protein
MKYMTRARFNAFDRTGALEWLDGILNGRAACQQNPVERKNGALFRFFYKIRLMILLEVFSVSPSDLPQHASRIEEIQKTNIFGHEGYQLCLRGKELTTMTLYLKAYCNLVDNQFRRPDQVESGYNAFLSAEQKFWELRHAAWEADQAWEQTWNSVFCRDHGTPTETADEYHKRRSEECLDEMLDDIDDVLEDLIESGPRYVSGW